MNRLAVVFISLLMTGAVVSAAQSEPNVGTTSTTAPTQPGNNAPQSATPPIATQQKKLPRKSKKPSKSAKPPSENPPVTSNPPQNEQ